MFILGEVDKKIKILMGLVPIGPLDLFHHIFIDLFMYSFVYSINTCSKSMLCKVLSHILLSIQ